MSTFLFMNFSLFLVISIVFVALFLIPSWASLDFFPSGKLKSRKNLVIRDEIYIKEIDLIQALKFKPDREGQMKAEVKGDLIFENCIFYRFNAFTQKNGQNYRIEFMGNLIFKNCIFQDEVDLSHIIVRGHFKMISSEFTDSVRFKNAWFKGHTNVISNCTFFNDVHFSNSNFQGVTRIEKNDFNLHCLFDTATFQQSITLRDSVFSGYSEFEKAMFRNKFEMINVQFKDRTNFKDMKVKEPAILSKVRFARKCDLSMTEDNIFADLSEVDFEAGYFVPYGFRTQEQVIL